MLLFSLSILLFLPLSLKAPLDFLSLSYTAHEHPKPSLIH
ncbi:hypothetical protein CHCC20327_3708 [Bacillus licheniformis]|nr:hypothetical protein CHCC20327_3708 [Bacillus licheniformis]